MRAEKVHNIAAEVKPDAISIRFLRFLGQRSQQLSQGNAVRPIQEVLPVA
jgi:hypothetical protein